MKNPYKPLFLVVGIHFVIMYLLVFSPVNALSDAKLFNLRSFYKALVMVSPMVFLMVFFMRSMYEDPQKKAMLYVGSLVVFVLSFVSIRTQALVGNEQFLKSMIPHHSSAITMCEEASITDPEIVMLCEDIVRTQQEEINEMNRILDRY